MSGVMTQHASIDGSLRKISAGPLEPVISFTQTISISSRLNELLSKSRIAIQREGLLLDRDLFASEVVQCANVFSGDDMVTGTPR